MAWVALDKTVTTQLLIKLSRLAAATLKLELADKLEQGRKTIAMMRRNQEITYGGLESNPRGPEEEEQQPDLGLCE